MFAPRAALYEGLRGRFSVDLVGGGGSLEVEAAQGIGGIDERGADLLIGNLSGGGSLWWAVVLAIGRDGFMITVNCLLHGSTACKIQQE